MKQLLVAFLMGGFLGGMFGYCLGMGRREERVSIRNSMELSAEDLEILENLDLLQNMEFLKEDMDFWEHLQIFLEER